jgi:hypothetical protein
MKRAHHRDQQDATTTIPKVDSQGKHDKERGMSRTAKN